MAQVRRSTPVGVEHAWKLLFNDKLMRPSARSRPIGVACLCGQLLMRKVPKKEVLAIQNAALKREAPCWLDREPSRSSRILRMRLELIIEANAVDELVCKHQSYCTSGESLARGVALSV